MFFFDPGWDIDAAWVFLLAYVGTIGFFTWRVARIVQLQRAAEHLLRERLARRYAALARSQMPR